jgi:hypothetical protein
MVLRNLNLNDFTVPFSRLASTERFPLSSFPKAWNGLDNVVIKLIRCKSDFNAKLKEHLLGQLDSDFKCTKVYCAHTVILITEASFMLLFIYFYLVLYYCSNPIITSPWNCSF